jgi:hypothetical protein
MHLFMYNTAVKRSGIVLNPFPKGKWWGILRHFVAFLLWAAVATVLVITLLIPEVIGKPPIVQIRGQPVYVTWAWLAISVIYVVLVWGPGILAQRDGYQISWVEQMRQCFKRGPGGKGNDPEQLLYPAENLKMQSKGRWVNILLWVITLAIKIAFEYFIVIWNMTEIMTEVRG